MKIDEIAKLAHEANRAYCHLIGDHSPQAWEDMSQAHRDSMLRGVQLIISNPALSPEEGHKAWMADKKAQGWKQGPVKSEEKKEHPCLVPYGSLPITQRFKDYLFHSVVTAALSME